MWQLVLRLSGQCRFVGGGMGRPFVTGWDMAAALAMGRALGLPGRFIADILPEIEAVMVRELRKEAAGD
ncbi:MAG: hypothetical protein KBF85_06530 [Tabrizicola sp.]|nr:hypothetical protein [Tabrizicola sp.]